MSMATHTISGCTIARCMWLPRDVTPGEGNNKTMYKYHLLRSTLGTLCEYSVTFIVPPLRMGPLLSSCSTKWVWSSVSMKSWYVSLVNTTVEQQHFNATLRHMLQVIATRSMIVIVKGRIQGIINKEIKCFSKVNIFYGEPSFPCWEYAFNF